MSKSQSARKNKAGKSAKSGATKEPGQRPGRKPDPFGRDKLLDAAALAFMERGYSGTSIDDVTDLLGATKGFFYHHFSSKSELYFGVMESAMRHIDVAVRAVFEQNLKPDLKLERMAEQHALVAMKNFPSSKVGVQGLEKNLLKTAGVSERRNLRRIIRMRDEYESMFSSTIEKGIKAKVFRDEPVGLMARGVLGALNWITMWFDPTRTTTAAQKKAMAEKLAAFVTAGLRK